MARQFTEAEIDFDGVAGDLSRLVPPKVTLEEILGRLREVMLERKDKGVTVRQMVKVLDKRGINVCGLFIFSIGGCCLREELK